MLQRIRIKSRSKSKIKKKGSVILPTELGHDSEGFPLVRRWRTVALSHMVQFTDIDDAISGKRPKRRK
jgi:hypothetical protein